MKPRGCKNLGQASSRRDITCTIKNGVCTCDCATCGAEPEPTDPPVEIPNVPEVCDAGECPVSFPGTGRAKACRNLGQVPGNRKDIICTISNGLCTCSCPTCGVEIPNVPEVCDAGNCPVSFPGGPQAKACRAQGKVGKRRDIKCVVRSGMCTCSCPN